MIVIGSQALAYRLKENERLQERASTSDFDVIMNLEEFMGWQTKYDEFIKSLRLTQDNKYKAIVEKDGVRKQYEIELGFEGTSSAFLLAHKDKVCEGEKQGVFGEALDVLSLNYQLLTKRSHLIYPVHFEKNIQDYHLLKSYLGDFDRDERMNEYYQLRSNEAKERYKQKTPKLNVTVEKFFDSKLPVDVYFVHDDLHEVMKHQDEPIYKKMQRDHTMAKCEKDMFFALPFDYQVQAVQEEAYVIALERFIIPKFGEDWHDHEACYKKAVKKICTNLTSGWFRAFAIEHYDELMKRFNPDFYQIFKTAFETGKINPVENKSREEVLMH